jgi:hypothetical protein
MEPIRDIPHTPPSRDYIRADDASWGPFPVIIFVAFALLVAYLLFGTFSTTPPDRPVTSQRETLPKTAPTVPNAPTPAPAPTPQ